MFDFVIFIVFMAIIIWAWKFSCLWFFGIKKINLWWIITIFVIDFIFSISLYFKWLWLAYNSFFVLFYFVVFPIIIYLFVKQKIISIFFWNIFALLFMMSFYSYLSWGTYITAVITNRTTEIKQEKDTLNDT